MRSLLFILFVSVGFISFAQQDTIYFTDYWRLCDEAEAGYYRVYSKSGKNYLIDDYYVGGQLYMSTISTTYVKLNRIGRTTFYYESGQKQQEGDYIKNEEEGEWKSWFVNGALKSVGNYSKTKKIGFWKEYHENSKVSLEGFFVEGERNGLWKNWYDNSQLKCEGSYSSGKKIKGWEGYFENGNLKYNENYNNEGELHGLSKYWHNNETLSSEKFFSEGKIVKGGKSYHKNGNVNLVYNYSDNGEKIGDWEQFYESGAINIKGSFKNGEKQGEWIEYYPDSLIKVRGYYNKGLKNQDWTYSSKKGIVVAKLMYKNNLIKSRNLFDDQANIIKGQDGNSLPFFGTSGNDLKNALSLNLEIPNDSVISGDFIIGLTISSDGVVEKVYSVDCMSPFIDSAMVKAFRKLGDFAPGKRNNLNEKYFLDIQVRLRSNNTIDLLEHYISSNPENDIDVVTYDNYDEVFTVVENMPEYPGGLKEMFSFLGANVKYPPSAKAYNISGKVYVNFTVRRTGLVTGIRIVRGVHQLLDNEALRVVAEFPKWHPGYQRGKPVSVSYNLPISFTLR